MNENDNGEIPIIVWADPEISPLGQRSKLLDDLAGRPVLRQTMERVCRSENSGQKIIFCRPGHVETLRPVVAGLPVEILPMEFPIPGWQPGLRAARKWALDCWRGGLASACAFDEDLLAHVLVDLVKRLNVPAVMVVQAHAAWVDPKVLDRQISQYREYHDEIDYVFTQAPPGLTGLVLGRNTIVSLLQGAKIPGSLIGYNPAKPIFDLISLHCNLPIDPAVVQTPIRFTCDTDRGLTLGRKLAGKLDPLTADISEVTSLGREEGMTEFQRRPKEIEIELVSGWAWPKGYRPIPTSPRGPIDPDVLIKRVGEVARECDDLVVHLGGFGEPTRHPYFEAIVNGLKSAGVFGISLATSCLFEPDMAEKIATLPIDVVNPLIDVPERALYTKVMGLDGYEKVQSNIAHILKLLQTQNRAIPLVVPEMIKTYETMELMDEFFDTWIGRTGSAVIRGYSDYAGQVPDLSVNSMAGPTRHTCRQIFRRMIVLANGQVTMCDQDFEGRFAMGSIQEDRLLDLWQGGSMISLREAHLAGHFSPNMLCEKCRQWHRP